MDMLGIPLPSTTQEWLAAIGLLIAILVLLFGSGIIPRLLSRFTTPVTSEAWVKKGLKNYQIGKLDEAISCFNEALEIDHENIDAWYYKVDPLKTLGRDKEANIAFSKAIALKAKKQRLLNK
jgi:tetratricopeptide (TPR) repeat protein